MTAPLRPRDLQLVQSGRGLVAHLALARDFYRAPAPLTLCGRPATAESIVPVELSGCLTCCRKALDGGVERLTDVTGDQVLLATVLESPWRR